MKSMQRRMVAAMALLGASLKAAGAPADLLQGAFLIS